MAFDADGFTKAAQGMGATPEEIQSIIAIKQAQQTSPNYIQAQQLKTTQANQAELNYKTDLANQPRAVKTYTAPNRAPAQGGSIPTPQQPAFDRAGAKAAGYTDAQIDAYLSGNAGSPIAPAKPQQGAQPQNTQGTLGRIVSGGYGDVKNIVKGLVNIPVGYVDAALKGKSLSNHTADLAVGMGKGIINEYSDLVGVTTKNNKPVLPQDKSVFQKGGFNAPTGANVDKAIGHAIDHPVNTLLDVLPIASAIKGARATTAAKSAKVSTGVNTLDDAISKGPKGNVTLPAIKRTAPEASIVPKGAVDQYNSVFTIPTKRAKDLRPKETASAMIKYQIAGDSDVLMGKVNAATGSKGVFTHITRGAINDTQATVSLKGLPNHVKGILDDAPEITAAEQTKVVNSIKRAIKSGDEMSASEAFALQQRLEKQGHQYLNSSTYLTGNVKNEQLGNAYLAAADDIGKQISTKVDDAGSIEAYKTPENVAIIREISPVLADEFMKAKTIKEVRSLAAPFVRLGKIIELTEQSKNSSFANLATQMQKTSLVPDNAMQILDPMSYISKGMKMSKERAIENAGSMEVNTQQAVAAGAAPSVPPTGGKGMLPAIKSGVKKTGEKIKTTTSRLPAIARIGQFAEKPEANNKPANNGNSQLQNNVSSNGAQDKVNHVTDSTLPPIVNQGDYITGSSPEYWNQQYQLAMQQNPPDMNTAKYALEQRDYETKNKAAGGKGATYTAGQEKEISDFQDGISILTNLETTIDSYKDMMGPVRGTYYKMNPYASEAQVFNSEMLGVAQTIGKAMEGGVLRAEDVPKYRAILPNIQDTPATAKGKIKNVVKLLENRLKIKANTYGVLQNTPEQPTDQLPPIE